MAKVVDATLYGMQHVVHVPGSMCRKADAKLGAVVAERSWQFVADGKSQRQHAARRDAQGHAIVFVEAIFFLGMALGRYFSQRPHKDEVCHQESDEHEEHGACNAVERHEPIAQHGRQAYKGEQEEKARTEKHFFICVTLPAARAAFPCPPVHVRGVRRRHASQ